MPTNVTTPYQRFALTSGTAVAGNAEVALNVAVLLNSTGGANSRMCVDLVAVRVIRATGATVTTIQPRVYDTSGAAAGTIAEKWRAAAATAPGTLVNTYNIHAPMYVTSDGLLYFKVDGDALDTFFYELIFVPGS